jgi:hypothetical protein
MIWVHVSNKKKNISETMLMSVPNKNSLFNIILKVNIMKVTANKKDNSFSHYLSLYDNYINEELEKTGIFTFFDFYSSIYTSTTDNKTIYSVHYVSKLNDLNFKLDFEILPTNDKIYLLSNSQNHMNILSVQQQIIKRAEHSATGQMKIIDIIDNAELSITNLDFNADNINIPDFKRLKKIDILY